MTPLLRRLRLRTMPHFTTLHKFSLRLKTHTLDGLLLTLASSVNNARDVIIDSTVMQSGSASYYFVLLHQDDVAAQGLDGVKGGSTAHQAHARHRCENDDDSLDARHAWP
jgi:hypothetical protein